MVLVRSEVDRDCVQVLHEASEPVVGFEGELPERGIFAFCLIVQVLHAGIRIPLLRVPNQPTKGVSLDGF